MHDGSGTGSAKWTRAGYAKGIWEMVYVIKTRKRARMVFLGVVIMKEQDYGHGL